MNKTTQYKINNRQAHVLVVEDEAHVGLFVEVLLVSRGYKVSLCSDGVMALAAFDAQPWQYDLVLTDQNMPKMCGVELAKKIRAIRADVPIILCSGLATDDVQASAAGLGITAWIAKPLRNNQLLSLLARFLDSDYPRDRQIAGR